MLSKGDKVIKGCRTRPLQAHYCDERPFLGHETHLHCLFALQVSLFHMLISLREMSECGLLVGTSDLWCSRDCRD